MTFESFKLPRTVSNLCDWFSPQNSIPISHEKETKRKLLTQLNSYKGGFCTHFLSSDFYKTYALLTFKNGRSEHDSDQEFFLKWENVTWHLGMFKIRKKKKEIGEDFFSTTFLTPSILTVGMNIFWLHLVTRSLYMCGLNWNNLSMCGNRWTHCAVSLPNPFIKLRFVRWVIEWPHLGKHKLYY